MHCEHANTRAAFLYKGLSPMMNAPSLLNVSIGYGLLLLTTFAWFVPHICWFWPVLILLLYCDRYMYQADDKEATLHINWMINTAWLNMVIMVTGALLVTLLCWNSSVDMDQVNSMSELLAVPGSTALITTVVLCGVIAPVWPLYRVWHGLSALEADADPREYKDRRLYSIAVAVLFQAIALIIMYFE